MEEKETQVSETQVSETPVSETPVSETQVSQTQVSQTQPEAPVETPEQINFKALREAKRAVERERDELAAKIASSQKNTNDQPDANTSTAQESEAEATKREIREIKESLRREREAAETRKIEAKLLETYPDLEKVVNMDNIEVLKARDANFAKLVASNPSSPSDLYNRAIAAYSLIKKYGIHVDDNHSDDRAKVEANMAKPRPASAASTASEGLADFAGFVNMNTEERRRAIFEMARKRANG
jgi:hypothetical protein